MTFPVLLIPHPDSPQCFGKWISPRPSSDVLKPVFFIRSSVHLALGQLVTLPTT